MKKTIASMVLAWLIPCMVMAGGFIITEENDCFSATPSDNFYTQGLKIMGIGEVDRTADGRLIRDSYGIENIFYSPKDIAVALPTASDRPWAGITAALYERWMQKPDALLRFELMLGVTGPWSDSDHIQTEFHKMIGSHKPEGWQYQTPNEPVVNVAFEWLRPEWQMGDFQGWSADLAASYGFDAGTAFDDAFGGGIARAGWNLPGDYRTGVIAPKIGRIVPKVALKCWRPSVYVFASEEAKVVLHNVTLGGSLFQTGPSRPMRPFTTEERIGWATFLERQAQRGESFDVGLSWSWGLRSPEFYGQKDMTDFGTIILSAVWGY